MLFVRDCFIFETLEFLLILHNFLIVIIYLKAGA